MQVRAPNTGTHGTHGCPEGAGHIGSGPTEHHNPDAHEDEGQERPDAHELAEHADRQQTSRDRRRPSPVRIVLRYGVRNRGWTRAEHLGEQPIPAHGKEDAGLAEKLDQDVLKSPKSALIFTPG